MKVKTKTRKGLNVPPQATTASGQKRWDFSKCWEIPAWVRATSGSSGKFPSISNSNKAARFCVAWTKRFCWWCRNDSDGENIKTHHPLRFTSCVSVRLKYTTYVNRLAKSIINIIWSFVHIQKVGEKNIQIFMASKSARRLRRIRRRTFDEATSTTAIK